MSVQQQLPSECAFSTVATDCSSCDVSQRQLPSYSEPWLQLIDDLPEQIALLDENCTIFAANRAWKDAVTELGYMDALPGGNYRDFCCRKANEGYEPAVEALAALDDMRSGQRSFWQYIYNGRQNWAGRDYQITFHQISFGDRHCISVTRFDLTEILQLRGVRTNIAASLIEAQASERLRMGRELHDSASQLLTAIGLAVGQLRPSTQDRKGVALLDEIQDLLSEVHHEIRSISYLAHPPSLDRFGLLHAIKMLVEGFGRRTGLETSLDVLGNPLPMSEAVESAIYRLAQEALSNVHRHAHATRVRLQLHYRGSMVHFIVADDGVGTSAKALEGVGLAGMRSRLSEVSGRLGVRPLSPGTAIVASVPTVAPRQVAAKGRPSWQQASRVDPAFDKHPWPASDPLRTFRAEGAD